VTRRRAGIAGGALAGLALAALETGVRYLPALADDGGAFELAIPLAAAVVYALAGGAAGALRWWCGVLAPALVWMAAPARDLLGAELAIAAGGLGWLSARHPRRSLVLGGVAALTLLALLPRPADEPTAAASAPPRPDVLLVVLDTVGARFTSLHGYELDTTPTLVRMAAEGVWFRNAVAAAPWTVPSHASFFTGEHPRVVGGHHEHPALRDEPSTTAEILAAAGYRTGAFVANPWVGRFNGLTRGFEHQEALWKILRPVRAFAAFRLAANWLAARAGKGAALLTERALAWWDRAGDRPSFVFLNLMEAHSPFHQVPAAGRYGVQNARTVGERAHLAQMQGPASIDYPRPGEVEASQRLHAAGIRYLDETLGQLVDALRERGRLDRTVIVLTSDHGEGFGEHGFYGHMLGLYEETLHVPLVIRYPPAIEPGTVVDEPVSLRRLHDTLLALSGVAESGRSLLAAEGERGDSYVISEQTRPLQVLRDYRRHSPGDLSYLNDRALRIRRGSLVLQRKTPADGGVARWFFFDLSSDPGETRSLWPDPRAAALRAALEAHDARPLSAGGELRLPVDLREQLLALGYVANP
jgi:arylsulfatase A-like enzyme